MTRAIVLAVLGGLLTISTPLRAQSGNAEQALLQLERDWEQANVKNDAAALERILALEFVSTDSDGRVHPFHGGRKRVDGWLDRGLGEADTRSMAC